MPPPRFRVARPGYVTGEVDAFIDRLAGATSRLPATMTSDEVRRTRFGVSRTVAGYSTADVDAWMDRVVGALRVSEQASGRVAASPASWTPSRRAPTRDPASDPGRNAVQELPGTPVWVRVTALLLVIGMIGLFVASYFL